MAINRRYHRAAIGLLVSQFIATACFLPRPAEIPIPYQFHESKDQDKKSLVIFLPGRGDDIGAYERASFIDILKASSRPLDSVVVDGHLGYYIDRSLAERVHQDVMLPFREQGYEDFIVVGVSMGGVGALRLVRDYGDLVSGAVLLAPFLGDEKLLQELTTAGDLHSWREGLDHEPELDEQIWIWIDSIVSRDSHQILSTILAYGQKDKLRPGAEYFSGLLPESHTFTNDGGHGWNTWTPLWSDITKSEIWENLDGEK